VPVAVLLALPEGVTLGGAELDAEPEEVPVAQGDEEGVGEPVALAVKLCDSVLLPVAPLLADGDCDPVEVEVVEPECVASLVRVSELVALLLAVAEGGAVELPEPLDVPDPLDVAHGVAVEDAEAVELPVARGDKEGAEEPVALPVKLCDDVLLPVAVPLADSDCEAADVEEAAPVCVASLLPVGVPVALPLALEEGVGAEEPALLNVPVALAAEDALAAALVVALAVAAPVVVAEAFAEDVRREDAVAVLRAVAVGLEEADGVAVAVGGAKNTRRMRLFPMSAITKLPSAGLNAALRGQRNVAAVPSPSAEPSVRAVLPATVVTAPAGVTKRTLWFKQSATSRLPPAYTATELLLLNLNSALAPSPSA